MGMYRFLCTYCVLQKNDEHKMNIAKTSLRPSFLSCVSVRCSLLDIFESISQEWWGLIITKGLFSRKSAWPWF